MKKFLSFIVTIFVASASFTCNVLAEDASEAENPCEMGLILDENEKQIDFFSISTEFDNARSVLPKSVDLSKSPCFPPIGNQKDLGACCSFATTYYQFSYEVNKLNNVSSKSQQIVYSPKWTYNLVNCGMNGGSTLKKNYEVLYNLGALKNSDCYYTGDSDDYLEIPNVLKDKKIEALKTRISDLYVINVPSDKKISSANSEELNAVKAALNKGKLLSVGSHFNWDSYYDPVSKECIAYRCKENLLGSHQFTIVGYDDNKSYDVNRNGKIEDCEKGAFKIANSWGTSYNGYGIHSETGYFWVMYDALNAESTNTYNAWESVCKGKRVPAFSFDSLNQFYYINVKHYDLNYIGELFGNLKNRSLFAFKIGKSQSESFDCSNEDYYVPFDGNYYKMGESVNYKGYFYFDFGSLSQPVSDYTNGYKWFAYIENMFGSDDVMKFRVVDDLAKGITPYATAYATKGTSAQLSKEISLKRGDMDYSGKLESKDAEIIASYVAGKVKLSNVQMYLADVNEDGVVNILDAAALSRLI